MLGRLASWRRGRASRVLVLGLCGETFPPPPRPSHPTANPQITTHHTPMDQSNKLSTMAPTCAGTNTTNLTTTCMFVRRTCHVLVVVYHTTKFANVITCWYLRCFRCIKLIGGWCVFTHFTVYEQRLCIGVRGLLIEAFHPRMAQGSRLHVGSREVHQGLS